MGTLVKFFSWEVQDFHYVLYNDSLIAFTELEALHQYHNTP